MIQEALSQYDIEVPLIEYEGKVYHQVIRSNQSYLTAASNKKEPYPDTRFP